MAKRSAEAATRSEVLKGTLDLLILHTLTLERMHGYAIVRHIKRLTDEALNVEAGSLYPALERLQKKGWLTSRWEASPTGRQARYYTITAAGRKQLSEERSGYDRAVWAIERVLARG
jgi:transcriptional regulator